MKNYFTLQDDKKYLASGTWKCDKSPNGAHFWFIRTRQAKCKYCAKVREVDPVGAFGT